MIIIIRLVILASMMLNAILFTTTPMEAAMVFTLFGFAYILGRSDERFKP